MSIVCHVPCHAFPQLFAVLAREYPEPATKPACWIAEVTCAPTYGDCGMKRKPVVPLWFLTSISARNSQQWYHRCTVERLSSKFEPLRKFMFLENVGALLSQKCRPCMDYMQQAPCSPSPPNCPQLVSHCRRPQIGTCVWHTAQWTDINLGPQSKPQKWWSL